jgi:4-hydroxy-4-methyl-2-oxoglutarate aldolase
LRVWSVLASWQACCGLRIRLKPRWAQSSGTISFDLTALWKGERFPDGRPKVPDEILERMKLVTLNEAVSALLAKGYRYQFDGNWIRISPDKVLVGRAVTVKFMPLRADMLEGNKALTARNGDRFGTNKSNVSPALTAYDVPVVDLFGKREQGTYVGDNFATQIFANTGTGIVVDGNIIDIEGYRELPYFPVFARQWHTTHSADVMVTSTNAPIMVGGAPVLPGASSSVGIRASSSSRRISHRQWSNTLN